MKISVSSYSFASLVNSNKLDIFGVMDEAVRMGFEGLELDDSDDVMNPEAFARIREYSKAAGLPVIGLDIGADFTKNDLKSLDEEVERVKKILEMATILEVPRMRHDVCYGNFNSEDITFEEALKVMAEGCFRVADYAKTLGIKTMFENHGFYMQDDLRVKKLMDAVDHDNFGLLIDVGNFMCTDTDPVEATRNLAPYVSHVHAKDFHFKNSCEPFPGDGWFETSNGNFLRGAIIGHGDARTHESIKILKDSGYDGYVTLEFEGIEDNIKGISLGLDNLRKYI